MLLIQELLAHVSIGLEPDLMPFFRLIRAKKSAGIASAYVGYVCFAVGGRKTNTRLILWCLLGFWHPAPVGTAATQ
jgi:hypothetical protein